MIFAENSNLVSASVYDMLVLGVLLLLLLLFFPDSLSIPEVHLAICTQGSQVPTLGAWSLHFLCYQARGIQGKHKEYKY